MSGTNLIKILLILDGCTHCCYCYVQCAHHRVEFYIFFLSKHMNCEWYIKWALGMRTTVSDVSMYIQYSLNWYMNAEEWIVVQTHWRIEASKDQSIRGNAETISQMFHNGFWMDTIDIQNCGWVHQFYVTHAIASAWFTTARSRDMIYKTSKTRRGKSKCIATHT